MMRTTKLALSMCSVLALSLTCLAQNDPAKQNDPNKPARPGQPQIQTGQPGQQQYGDIRSDVRPFMGLRAKEVIGKAVENDQGKKVGDVNDMLIDLPQGRIAGVVVGVGGVLGVGEEPRIVPPQALHWTADQNKLHIKMDQQLRTAKTKASDLRSYNELGQVYRDFQQEPYWTKDTRQPVREREANRETEFRLRKAKELIGAKVENAADKKLGDIEDLIVDLHSGRVVLVAVGAGGFLGLGEKLVAFPPSQLQMNPDGKLMINISEERLKSSPQFDRAHWPSLHDANWVSQVYGHYGEQSYWSTGSRQPVRDRDLDKTPDLEKKP